ncbi:protein PHYLLO, chloroplastic isoform X4 [Iris pallida]|uniref:Protein PHYLLO, chloroplastic isoform X4 n=1 Tax=Iris pallida TaxID=29817 RepID=A0AAX6ESF0_IRIPA|nr:protein PHYLLO, chloroplastic isoform X4 [Iris pallida]KAJ6808205.1 protein PHYLLO, chloroplastic isoform X4 [Iris pallida]
MSVISSTFESSLGLSSYVQFAHYLERQNVSICKMQNRELRAFTAHGLGTYKWLKDDVTTKTLRFFVPPLSETMEASVKDADVLLRHIQINHGIIQRVYKGEEVRSYRFTIDGEVSYCVKVIEAGVQKNNKVIVFLHGFLGTSRDWIPIMNAMSATARCISIDLPGHGNSQPHWHITKESKQRFDISVESVADILMKLICRITKEKVILVGYSMGARIALNMVLKYNKKVDGAVIISGSPGLRDEVTRRIRATQDEAKAQYLMTHGLVSFLETCLRDHPHFMKIVESRANHSDVQALAQSLSGLSIGRQISLWEELKNCKKPLLFVVGEKDTKFKDISRQMCAEMSHQGGEIDRQDETLCEMIVVPDSGHAVHLENPLPVINAMSRFLRRVYGR